MGAIEFDVTWACNLSKPNRASRFILVRHEVKSTSLRHAAVREVKIYEIPGNELVSAADDKVDISGLQTGYTWLKYGSTAERRIPAS